MNDYPELTQAEYREKLRDIFDRIGHSQVLRYFYLFVSEKTKDTPWVFGTEVLENE